MKIGKLDINYKGNKKVVYYLLVYYLLRIVKCDKCGKNYNGINDWCC